MIKLAEPNRQLNLHVDRGLILTPRQVQILQLIRDYRNNNGYSPTMQEMARVLHLSKVTVFEHVEALVRKGLLQREPNKARSLILDRQVGLDESSAGWGWDRRDTPSSSGARTGQYPLCGYIAAGTPLEAIETPDTIELNSMFETANGTFALQVRGDSMIDEQIRDGDYVLVERCRQPSDGQIVVAILPDGEATLKKFYRQGKGFRLEGANPHFEPIYTDKVDVQGVVIGVVRRY